MPKKSVPWYKTKCGIAFITVALLSLLLGVINIIIGPIALDEARKNDGGSSFTLISDYELTFSVEPTSNPSYTSCGNFTITQTGTQFSNEALSIYRCPEPLDVCNENLCFDTDGACHEELRDTSTCSASFPCPLGQTCVDCACVSSSSQQCVTAAECVQFLNNPTCQAVSCILGQCIVDTAFGQMCSTNQECPTNQFCNSACICASPTALPIAVTYTPAIVGVPPSDTFDFGITSDIVFVYVEGDNFVDLSFQFRSFGNFSSTTFDVIFDFDLPPGLTANTVGFNTGSALQIPDEAFTGIGPEFNIITSTGRVDINTISTARATFLNQNPVYIGPNLPIFSFFRGNLRYQKLIV